MKSEIRQLISENRLFEAIQQMKTQKMKAKDQKALALTESRLNAINEKIRLGILSSENAELELNKLRHTVFDINEQIFRVEDPEFKQKQYIRYGAIALGVLLLGILTFVFFGPETCEDHKVGIFVANFQNVDRGNEVDGFANSVTTKLDYLLSESKYDITPVGYQTREVSRYDEYIAEEYFVNSCDTNGLFVNGFLDKTDQIFNIYLTLVGLELTLPEVVKNNSIYLSNPNGIEFFLPEDAEFLAEFVYALLQLYEGNPEIALGRFLDLEKTDKKGIIAGSKSLGANMAYFKGNCYVLTGQPKKATKSYAKAHSLGNSDIQQFSENNYKLVQKAYPQETNQSKSIQEISSGDQDIDKIQSTIKEAKAGKKILDDLKSLTRF